MFEKEVVTFEERKTISEPSSGGLYVAEILLLDYCSKRKYPHPKGGYPGFWWFTYGIRDVGAVLKSLEERGFLTYGPLHDALKGFTVAELKIFLQQKGAPVSGKKADLIDRVMENFSEEELLAAGMERKYVLTEKGRVELDENAYVPYMHKYPYKTVEGCENEFNAYIAFWEGLWKNGGLKFEGSGWHFTLPELYIKTKQYDKALQFLEYLKRKKPGYADKAMKYMERVQKLKEKTESKKG